MCSSPKPKRSVSTKTVNSSIGVLASMSSDKRISFAERANQASEKRIKAKQLKREEQHRINKLTVKKRIAQSKKTNTNKNKSWLYCLLNAPLSEIMRKLVS